LVAHESPSHDKPALDQLADVIAARFAPLAGSIERVPNGQGGDHLRIEPCADLAPRREGPPALILCHFDTVWPKGTLRGRPFRIEDGRAFGPGVYDMKASIVLVEFALRGLRALNLKPSRPIVHLLTSDEEIGSPTSRTLIEATARASAHVLVLEPPLPGDRLKTARKGVGSFALEIYGRAAHAGVEPQKGISALVELAHQVLALEHLADKTAGTTLNVGVARGGTAANVVPARATAQIDVRVATATEAQRIEVAMSSLKPILPGATLAVSGGFNRPPMERSAAAAALFAAASAIGRTIGLELGEGSTGGGSDGNFTAALGVPTLDGLGTPGAGAHAENEHILIDALPTRAALLAAMLASL
jgi:glutamate carboxypeptidase